MDLHAVFPECHQTSFSQIAQRAVHMNSCQPEAVSQFALSQGQHVLRGARSSDEGKPDLHFAEQRSKARSGSATSERDHPLTVHRGVEVGGKPEGASEVRMLFDEQGKAIMRYDRDPAGGHRPAIVVERLADEAFQINEIPRDVYLGDLPSTRCKVSIVVGETVEEKGAMVV